MLHAQNPHKEAKLMTGCDMSVYLFTESQSQYGKCFTIVKFTQLCSKFLPTALLNFACDWLTLDRDISFGLLTSLNV